MRKIDSKNTQTLQVQIIKPIKKADTITQNTESEYYTGDWIEPVTDLKGTILPQCIRAYKNNIAGFGLGIKYREDRKETSEMAAEFERAEEILELLTLEQDTKNIFENIIETRETYGIAYLEIIRTLAGEVEQIEFIQNTPSIRKTKPLEPYIETLFYHHGKEVKRQRKYCKYKQQIGGETVYFREFGDPRIMDNRNGKYLEEGQTLDLNFHANEILEFSIGTEPYGKVRWIGQVLSIDGARRAEGLNNNYFRNGRHTPLMILIKGGTLKEESFTKLQQYVNDIKGEEGQHAFIVLEAENKEAKTDFEQSEKPEIEVKDLANILQKDELFQDYLSNSRKKVQSSFLLPDLYVGYTTDFNRATAQMAQEVTEKQVFQPERKSLAWIINNKLLNCYQFKFVEVYFKEPNISNPDDLYKLLTVCNNAGGLTPNKAKQIIYEAYGETAEDYLEEWGNIPVVCKTQENTMDVGTLSMNLQKQIEKAARNHDDEVVAIMKEVKNVLLKIDKEDSNVFKLSSSKKGN